MERIPPTHVAIIMDGNRRWAEARHLPVAMGHRAGIRAIRRALRLCEKLGIKILTVYAFSTENWRRPKSEVDELMRLFKISLRREVDKLNARGICLRIIGNRDGLDPELVRLIEAAEEKTKANTRGYLNVAINYGGRDELVRAVRRIVREGISPEEIDEELFSSYLDTAGLPDPDLVIRTAGEQRLSNFLLWQSAYSEIVTLDVLWPDFGEADLKQAIEEYYRRERRFGGRPNHSVKNVLAVG